MLHDIFPFDLTFQRLSFVDGVAFLAVSSTVLLLLLHIIGWLAYFLLGLKCVASLSRLRFKYLSIRNVRHPTVSSHLMIAGACNSRVVTKFF